MDSAEDSFLKKKTSGDQAPQILCWRKTPTWEYKASTASNTGAPGSGWVRTGTEARSCLARRKGESSTGDQRRDLPRPFRALVRGART